MKSQLRNEVKREADRCLEKWRTGNNEALRVFLMSLSNESCPQAQACAEYFEEKTGGRLFVKDDGNTDRRENTLFSIDDFFYFQARLLRNFSRETFEALTRAGCQQQEFREDKLPSFLQPAVASDALTKRGGLQERVNGKSWTVRKICLAIGILLAILFGGYFFL